MADKPLLFTAPMMVTAYSDMGFIEGCTGGHKSEISGCDVQTPPPSGDGGGCKAGLGIITAAVGVGGSIVAAIIAAKCTAT